MKRKILVVIILGIVGISLKCAAEKKKYIAVSGKRNEDSEYGKD